jgi:hypothetical protein
MSEERLSRTVQGDSVEYWRQTAERLDSELTRMKAARNEAIEKAERLEVELKTAKGDAKEVFEMAERIKLAQQRAEAGLGCLQGRVSAYCAARCDKVERYKDGKRLACPHNNCPLHDAQKSMWE